MIRYPSEERRPPINMTGLNSCTYLCAIVFYSFHHSRIVVQAPSSSLCFTPSNQTSVLHWFSTSFRRQHPLAVHSPCPNYPTLSYSPYSLTILALLSTRFFPFSFVAFPPTFHTTPLVYNDSANFSIVSNPLLLNTHCSVPRAIYHLIHSLYQKPFISSISCDWRPKVHDMKQFTSVNYSKCILRFIIKS